MTVIFLFVITSFSECNAQENKIKRRDLQSVIIDQYLHKVEMQEIIFAASQKAPVHYHPCPVIGIVISGKILFQIDGEEARVLKEGDVFYEPKNCRVLHFDNLDSEASVKFVAAYLKESNEKSIELIH
ncbi:cupin domain-containing protein [Chryseobacterium sp. BIGb0232]|uniref:cupin domain-containing protein n=1 Tax=Chryseobacterium sp. BIGb0232 TaxID=2940598 RepID=UPI000FB011CC|nr:cupin domain-containing protein [Chryseobacterium sp. BIGb0232]MCS4300764.1 quercetin dioxygenase-like cupin family protein [Chryseobacterium sp. BIGb0232]ROS20356.1 cupin domain [Chryseobacterium nakagawai]